MSILQTHSCHSSYNRLKYVFNEPAHSYRKTTKRVLAASGFNIPVCKIKLEKQKSHF